MNLLSGCYLRILIIIGLVELCYSCGTHYDPLKNDQINPSWFVAIFAIPRPNSLQIHYEFKCLGALIDSKVVAVSALCVPMGMQDVISIRLYDWHNNRNITKHVAYEERNVSKMINFQQLHPGDVGRNDVNVLLLVDEFQSLKKNIPESYIPVQNYGEFIYERKYTIDTPNLICMFIDTKGDMNSGYDVKYLYVQFIAKPQCCEFFNYTDRKTHPFSPHSSKHIIIDDNCKIALLGKDCFKYSHTEEMSFVHPNPVVCPSFDNSPYLRGFFINRIKDYAIVSNFNENKAWIRETWRMFK